MLGFVLNMASVFVSVSFPHRPLSEGVKLLQTPEWWGTGPLLPFGVPNFQPENVEGPCKLFHKKAVAFEASSCPLRFSVTLHETGDRVDVNCNDLVRVQASVHPFNKHGFLLNVLVDSQGDAPDPDDISLWLQHFLFQSLDQDAPLLPVLDRFRGQPAV